MGAAGPVLLDAECATYGDPAFDVAFCLNHLLLKSVRRPDDARVLASCFTELAKAYVSHVTWEMPEAVERRIAALLPALLLARIDGKSPVEYMTSEIDKARVRQAARVLLASPPDRLDSLQDTWQRST